jgi:hypothetical protein
MIDAYEFKAIKAPWLDSRYSGLWAGYQPKLEKRDTSNDDMGEFLRKIDSKYLPMSPRPITCTLEQDGKLELLETILYQPPK